jgi:endonuclease/exonuclease/phosphatase family metal-dependent hydrolase
MNKWIYALLLFLFIGCKQETELKVLQFNIWQEGTVVPGGFDAIIEEIIRSDADLIALSEVRNYNNTSLDKRLVEALKQKGQTYYAQRSEDSGLLSRYPILSQEALYPVKNDQGSITKAIVDVKGKKVAFYSAHLDYRHCSLYLPRGYDGSTWAKLPQPITDIAAIAHDNFMSKRDEAIQAFIQDAEKESEQVDAIILAGDFNEPSHLDWTEATKDLFDHNGVVMPWQNTLSLEQAGFIDAYRQQYPNPVTHPGFTFPADNPLVDIKKLAWSPTADDRDRIDFIFYLDRENIALNNIKIVGPKGSIIRNQRIEESSYDPFELPLNVWPTDHKAVWASFTLK